MVTGGWVACVARRVVRPTVVVMTRRWLRLAAGARRVRPSFGRASAAASAVREWSPTGAPVYVRACVCARSRRRCRFRRRHARVCCICCCPILALWWHSLTAAAVVVIATAAATADGQRHLAPAPTVVSSSPSAVDYCGAILCTFVTTRSTGRRRRPRWKLLSYSKTHYSTTTVVAPPVVRWPSVVAHLVPPSYFVWRFLHCRKHKRVYKFQPSNEKTCVTIRHS